IAAAALSLLTGIVFGLAPAIQATRVDVMSSLKDLRSGATRRRGLGRISLSRTLIVAQIAITVMILVATALVARTLANLESIQLGFKRENVLTFELNARQAGHANPEIVALYED